jgi:hypothetical protein
MVIVVNYQETMKNIGLVGNYNSLFHPTVRAWSDLALAKLRIRLTKKSQLVV